MRVAIDMISAGAGFSSSGGAMVVYYTGLLRAMTAVADISAIGAFVSPWNNDLAIPQHAKVEVNICNGLPKHRLGRTVYEHFVLPALVKAWEADVLLSTCNVKPLLWRGPSTVVLQSMQYLYYPEQFGRVRTKYLDWAVRKSVQDANAIITVTRWEESEAIRLLALDPTRSTTIYHGLSDVVRAAAIQRAYLSPPDLVGHVPYVLMVSTLYRFKNHHRLLEAFARVVKDRNIPHRLVLAGQDADVKRTEMAQYAERLGIADRVVLPGGIPHNQIPALIANADAVAYPSLFETFGLPVLEALAFGRPLITSAGGATGEVAGTAACLVDPTDVDQIAAGLVRVLFDDSFRAHLATVGPTRAATFTWEECAERTAQVLRGAIARHRGFL